MSSKNLIYKKNLIYLLYCGREAEGVRWLPTGTSGSLKARGGGSSRCSDGPAAPSRSSLGRWVSRTTACGLTSPLSCVTGSLGSWDRGATVAAGGKRARFMRRGGGAGRGT